ncbi:hypothetical protein HK096_008466 [Nowakowskiella sp. JEL0078]|nr:hypothetical protein HK096_008466 [Nowakowskiella sp. JEL0078]
MNEVIQQFPLSRSENIFPKEKEHEVPDDNVIASFGNFALESKGSPFTDADCLPLDLDDHFLSDDDQEFSPDELEKDDEIEDEQNFEDSLLISFLYPPPPPIFRGRRGSVSAEVLTPSLDRNFSKTVISKSESQRLRIETSISTNFLFKNLDSEQHADVINAMEEHRVEANTVVIKQGNAGDYFYVVEQGHFDVFIDRTIVVNTGLNSLQSRGVELNLDEDDVLNETPHGNKVNEYGPGGCFGELALMYNAPRAATVLCTEEAVLWTLDRVTFRRLLIENMSRKTRLYEVLTEE